MAIAQQVTSANELFDSGWFVGVILVMSLISMVGFGALMYWGIFRKAGRRGWYSMVPVYQWVVLSEVAGRPSWWGWLVGAMQTLPFFFFPVMFRSMGSFDPARSGSTPSVPAALPFFGLYWIVSIASFVLIIFIAIDISKSFGKDAGWAVGLIFLNVVFYPILGFGSAQYLGPAAKGGVAPPPPAAPFPPPPPPPPFPPPPPPPAPPAP